MATLTLRTVKGSPLTNQEVDDNFTNLNNDKIELTDLSVVQNPASGSGSLTYDDTTGVFTYTPPEAGSGTPTTPDPTLAETNVDVFENDYVDVVITNYSATATYEVVDNTPAITSSQVISNYLRVNASDVASDQTVTVDIRATEAGSSVSDYTTLTVNVINVTVVADGEINDQDFNEAAIYTVGWQEV